MSSDEEQTPSEAPAEQEEVMDEAEASSVPPEEDESHAEDQSLAANATVATENDSHVDDERSMATAPDRDEDDEEGSKPPAEEDTSAASPKTPSAAETSATKKKPKIIPPSARKGRAPAVKGLTIPFRTVKKAMKLDPDIPIVQNEAAIMTTMAAELFLKSLAKESHRIAKNRARNTIRYEDVAEARANDPALAFLKTLLP